MLASTTGSLRLSREHCMHMDNKQARHRQLDHIQILHLLNLKYCVLAKSYLWILGLCSLACPLGLILKMVWEMLPQGSAITPIKNIRINTTKSRHQIKQILPKSVFGSKDIKRPGPNRCLCWPANIATKNQRGLQTYCNTELPIFKKYCTVDHGAVRCSRQGLFPPRRILRLHQSAVDDLT